MRKTSLQFVGILSCMLLMPFFASADNVLIIGPFEINAGETKELTISLENDKDITLVQFDLKLPEGLSIPVNSKNKYVVSFTDRTTLEDHSLHVNALNEGYLFLLASMENTAIEGNSGPLIIISLTANAAFAGGTITIDGIRLVSPDETAVSPSAVSISVSSVVSVFTPNSITKDVGKVYDLHGRQMNNRKQRGFHIVDGRKVSYSRNE